VRAQIEPAKYGSASANPGSRSAVSAALRIDRHAFVSQDLAFAGGEVEGFGGSVEIDQTAVIAVIENAGLLGELFEQLLRIDADTRLFLGVAAGPFGRALLQELQRP
jgi:hypothetical protein